MTARANLDGLGPTDGPVLTWAVPGNFAQAQPPVGLPFGFTPGPAPSSSTGVPGWASWLGLACLLLVVVLLLTRTRFKGPLR